MLVSDKWNPRLWLRDWLNKPSIGELQDRKTAAAASAQMFLTLEREARIAGDRALSNCLRSALNAPAITSRADSEATESNSGRSSDPLPTE